MSINQTDWSRFGWNQVARVGTMVGRSLAYGTYRVNCHSPQSNSQGGLDSIEMRVSHPLWIHVGAIALLIGGIIMPSPALARTEVSGLHWGTWDVAGSPYVVTGIVRVPKYEPWSDSDHNGIWDPNESYVDWDGNGTWTASFPPLIVEPGVTIISDRAYDDIWVDGRLEATDAKLNFTSLTTDGDRAQLEVRAGGELVWTGGVIEVGRIFVGDGGHAVVSGALFDHYSTAIEFDWGSSGTVTNSTR